MEFSCPSILTIQDKLTKHDYRNSDPSSFPFRSRPTYQGGLYVWRILCPIRTCHSLIALSVDWANLAAIDLSKAKTLEGRKSLVKQVHDAIKDDGFLFVVNHGATPEQVSGCIFKKCCSPE